MTDFGVDNKDLVRRLHDKLDKYKKSTGGYFENLKDLKKFIRKCLVEMGKLHD